MDGRPPPIHPLSVADRIPSGGQPEDVRERRLRRSWLSLVAAFTALAVFTALTLAVPDGRLSIVALGLVGVVGVVGLIYRRVVAELKDGRRMESESFQRILRGLSRSVSPDAIVNAIVEDLGVAAGADHTVVVRLRADARILEATLVEQPGGRALVHDDAADQRSRRPGPWPVRRWSDAGRGADPGGWFARRPSLTGPSSQVSAQGRTRAVLSTSAGDQRAVGAARRPQVRPGGRAGRWSSVGASVGALRASVAGHRSNPAPRGRPLPPHGSRSTSRSGFGTSMGSGPHWRKPS